MRLRPPPRALPSALAALAAALLLAACGGGGDSGPDQTEGLTPQQIVDRSAAAARDLRGVTLQVKGEVRAGLTPAATRAAPQLDLLTRGPLPIDVQGPVVPPDRFSLDLATEVSGLPVQANLTRVGDALYVGFAGRDFRLTVPAGVVRGLDAREVFPTVARWIEAPRADGDEEIDGEPTVRLVGRIDAEAAGEDLAGVLAATGASGGAVPAPAELRRRARAAAPALERGTVTLWVRTADLLPARARVVLDVPDARALDPRARSLSVDLTAGLSDYDGGQTVSAPEGAQPLDPGDLQNLFG
jgi:hypothetical protein